MTEENERPGDAGTPGVRPAGGSGERPVPPRPSSPPTSGTPVVPPAAPLPPPVRPSVPPVNRPDAGEAGAGAPRGAGEAGAGAPRGAGEAAGTAGTTLAGAGKAAAKNARRLGGWVRRQRPARIGAAAAAVVLAGALIWWLTSLGGGTQQPAADASPAASAPSAPASRGPLPLEGVGPLDFQLGDCFKDFDPEAQTSTVVECSSGHSAQLVAVARYADADSYPGRDALKQKALDTCKTASLAPKESDYLLGYRLAYPSSTSWDKGDRRVDCYVAIESGNTIMESLIP
ncbi:hypothetical protein ABIB49_001785 [Arthrobacter sp. UYCu512]|uniref:septum formation family protein n=1 Tax=Arthrobacter sp. UYCu512 TaxID=3156338 RepID=UPI00339708F0